MVPGRQGRRASAPTLAAADLPNNRRSLSPRPKDPTVADLPNGRRPSAPPSEQPSISARANSDMAPGRRTSAGPTLAVADAPREVGRSVSPRPNCPPAADSSGSRAHAGAESAPSDQPRGSARGSARANSVPTLSHAKLSAAASSVARVSALHRRHKNGAALQEPCANQSETVLQADTDLAKVSEGHSSDKILECFKFFDENGDGKISREELAHVLRALDKFGLFHEEDMQAVMNEVDTSNDGSINYAEFAEWLGNDHRRSSYQLREHVEEVLEEGTPQARLECCLEALQKGKLAAMPPKPIEAIIEERELWMFSKKGQTMEDARASKEPTTVYQISPTSTAFKAGVRFGMRVVGVAGRSMQSSANLLDPIVKCMGGGGATGVVTRSVTMQFVTLAVIQAQEEALETLQRLVADAEAAKARCNRLIAPVIPSTSMVENTFVSVKYYNNTACFSIDEGKLAVAEIDNVFQISEGMPSCNLYLAASCHGDAHIVAADQITLNAKELGLAKTDGASRAHKPQEGQNLHTTFINLVPHKTYSLIVVPGKDSRDAEWRARMQKKAHAERLAILPPHDCIKERVPFGIRVSTMLGEFSIEIDNRQGRLLGINAMPDPADETLRVEDVISIGLVSTWNTMYPIMAVKYGDRIMEINGIRNSAKMLMKELQRHDILKIKLRRVDFEIGDQVMGLYQNGNWYKAWITRDNNDSTFTLQWCEGREDDRIKGPFELKKREDHLSIKDWNIRLNGDYWFFGSHNGRAMYKNRTDAVISFMGAWRINFSEDSAKNYYSAVGFTGVCPPKVDWVDSANPGHVASISYLSSRVCRLCTQPVHRDVDDGSPR